MPKSSRDTVTPNQRSRRRTSVQMISSCGRKICSVTSSSRCRRSNWHRSAIRSTVSTRSPRRHWLSDMLTASVRSVMPVRSHSDACRHVCSRTQAPSGTMRPLASATGMNASGNSAPRPGCDHRSNASTAAISALAKAELRLVVDLQALAVDRLAQVALHRLPALDRRRHVNGIKLVGVASLLSSRDRGRDRRCAGDRPDRHHRAGTE